MSDDYFPARNRLNYDMTVRHQMGEFRVGNWDQVIDLPKFSYTCGFCRNLISNARGYSLQGVLNAQPRRVAFIHICHICHNPTYFNPDGDQLPTGAVGKNFKHVPNEFLKVYSQALRCLRADCVEASVLVCRRLLMVIAYRLNAEEGKTFQFYVDYLVECDAITKSMKPWVDKIRQIGNVATHTIPSVSKSDAENVVKFVELLFGNLFEGPGDAEIPTPYLWRPPST